MANICIPKELVGEVKKIVDQNLSTFEREKALKSVVGDIAPEINLLYEKSLLRKNQELALNRFVENLTDVGAAKKAKLKEAIRQNLEQRKEDILDKDLESIVKDVVDRKYETSVTPEQTGLIMNAKKAVRVAEKLPDGNPDKQAALGYAKLNLRKTIEDIVKPTNNMGISEQLKTGINKIKQEYKAQPGTFEKGKYVVGQVFKGIGSGVWKSVKASVDLSGQLKQGFKMLINDPKQYWSTTKQVMNGLKKFGKQEVMDAFHAKQMGDPLFDEASDAGLRLINREEYFPTSIQEKIGLGIGKVFKATDDAFTMLTQDFRFEKYKQLRDIYISQHGDTALTNEVKRELADYANSLSGSGGYGKFEKIVPTLNNILFSPRFIKSQLDTILKVGSSNDVVRKDATKTLAKYVAATLGTMGGAQFMGSNIEWNPTSSKFGKILVPGTNRWVPVDDGLFSYLTLVARIGTGEVKSANTNSIELLNTGKYGKETKLDKVLNFGINKLAPVPAIVATQLRGKTFSGEKPTLGSQAQSLVAPIAVPNVVDILKDNNMDAFEKALMSGFEILGKSSYEYGAK